MKSILYLSFFVGLILLCLAVGLEIAAVDSQYSANLAAARSLVASVNSGAWDFARPLIQLMVVFVILEWVASRVGLSIDLKSLKSNTWNVQTFIAGMIITTFCVAVLADIRAVGYLKEVVLIVIGFYFGTRAKSRDDTDGSGGGDGTFGGPVGSAGYTSRSGASIVMDDAAPAPKGAGESAEEGRRQSRSAFDEDLAPKGDRESGRAERLARGFDEGSNDGARPGRSPP